jgi:RNA polymerase-interacting CarD/CdnL/TRCF family regulator
MSHHQVSPEQQFSLRSSQVNSATAEFRSILSERDSAVFRECGDRSNFDRSHMSPNFQDRLPHVMQDLWSECSQALNTYDKRMISTALTSTQEQLSTAETLLSGINVLN